MLGQPNCKNIVAVFFCVRDSVNKLLKQFKWAYFFPTGDHLYTYMPDGDGKYWLNKICVFFNNSMPTKMWGNFETNLSSNVYISRFLYTIIIIAIVS